MTYLDGPDNLAASVAEYLRSTLPELLGTVRAAEGIGAADLPDPRLVASEDLPEIAVEDYPAVLVLPERMVSITPNRRGPGVSTFDVVYEVAVETYVRGVSFPATGSLNRRYAAAVRWALTAAPSLRPSAFGASVPRRLVVTSMTEDYSPTFETSRGRTIASTRRLVQIHQEEQPPHPASPPVLSVGVTVTTPIKENH